MDKETLLAAMEFGRNRLLGTLETIRKSGQDVQKVLAWRPGPGRAHIAWQAMHLAATHDRYINQRLRNAPVVDPALVSAFAGGSTPSDDNIPSLETILQALGAHYHNAREYIKTLSADDLQRVTEFPNNVKRTIGESLILLVWHEAHHQGQMHLTWNLYKAAQGIA